ncbi:unnamed protein product [Macrosiphum euphorbiae]|uniref:Uncharacterized protein n=1 Tax=Macrosiphum euphorbiae TaxID=13131 RepID=A0AAV0WTF3_9HEMI|nr:unnamed protein product [Macrosiphum euphorbiae]
MTNAAVSIKTVDSRDRIYVKTTSLCDGWKILLSCRPSASRRRFVKEDLWILICLKPTEMTNVRMGFHFSVWVTRIITILMLTLACVLYAPAIEECR